MKETKDKEFIVKTNIEKIVDNSIDFDDCTEQIIEYAKIQQLVSIDRFFEIVNDIINI